MIRIGAVMSEALFASLRDSLEGDDVGVVRLGRSFRRADLEYAGKLDGLICELSEAALEGYAERAPGLRSIPCAGLPVVLNSQELASEAGIMAVIRRPDDLSQWMASLAVSSQASSPGSAGKIIAIWGPAGSPGRSTVALCLAATLARRGERVMLVDGDSYAPSLAPLLGLSQTHSGVVAMSRHARLPNLEASTLEACAVQYELDNQSLGIITGLSKPAQYVDCGSLAWAAALRTLRAAGHTLVVDVAEPLLQLPGETIGGPLRNALTIATLEAADKVVVVVNPIPLSILRLSRDWPRLTELAQARSLDVCLNNAPSNSQNAIDDSVHALWQFTGQDEATVFPRDRLWSEPSVNVAALLSAPEGKNLLMMNVGRFVTSRWGITPTSAPRLVPSGVSRQRLARFSLPDWAKHKKRLP
jgi:MinD-like ATPase involved in chromosome partitioning or flagellar assembly